MSKLGAADLKDRINEAVFDALDEIESNPELDLDTNKAAQIITDAIYSIIVEGSDDGDYEDPDPFVESYPQVDEADTI